MTAPPHIFGRLFAFAALFADFRHVLAILSYFGPSAPTDFRHVLAILGHLGAASLANLRHMIAIL